MTKVLRHVPKSQRKKGQSPFEEVTTSAKFKGDFAHTAIKEDLQVLRVDATIPIPKMGLSSLIKPPLRGFVRLAQNSIEHSSLPERRIERFDP